MSIVRWASRASFAPSGGTWNKIEKPTLFFIALQVPVSYIVAAYGTNGPKQLFRYYFILFCFLNFLFGLFFNLLFTVI